MLTYLPFAFSAVALVISVFNAWRSVIGDRRSRALAYAQKKHELLALLTKEEATIRSAKRQLEAMRRRASTDGVQDVLDTVDPLLGDFRARLDSLRMARTTVLRVSAKDASPDDLLAMVEKHLPMLGSGDVAEYDDGLIEVLDASEESLKRHKAMKNAGGVS